MVFSKLRIYWHNEPRLWGRAAIPRFLTLKLVSTANVFQQEVIVFMTRCVFMIAYDKSWYIMIYLWHCDRGWIETCIIYPLFINIIYYMYIIISNQNMSKLWNISWEYHGNSWGWSPGVTDARWLKNPWRHPWRLDENGGYPPIGKPPNRCF